MKQNTWIAVVFVAALAFFVYAASTSGTIGAPATSAGSGAAAVIVDGKQIVSLTAKGGYAPAVTEAKAGVPTVLRVTTSGTYDCSSSLRVPTLGVSQRLPATGVTDIDLGTPAAGTLNGTCSMGMYRFAVNFK